MVGGPAVAPGGGGGGPPGAAAEAARTEGGRPRRRPSVRGPARPVRIEWSDQRRGPVVLRPGQLGLADRAQGADGSFRALQNLVLTAPVGSAPAGLMRLAQRFLLSRSGWASYAATRSAPLSRALRERGLAVTSAAEGVRDLPNERRFGLRPQTQIGTSGGQMQPRCSAAMKRLTMRSSREW